MLPDIQKVKGIHPGAILDREFRKRGIRKSAFAVQIGEYPGIITDITRLRRGINARLSLRIEQALNAQEGYFMVLQAYYEINEAKKKEYQNNDRPELSLIRPILFWDVDIRAIDFMKRKSFVIKRVFERGNKTEIQEIIRFYGKKECARIIKSAPSLMFTAIKNGIQFLDLNREDLLCLKDSVAKKPGKPYYRSLRNYIFSGQA